MKLMRAVVVSAGLWFGGFAQAMPIVDLDGVPMLTTDTAAIQAAITRASDNPRVFAVPQHVTRTIADGRWSQEGDMAVWRLRVFSAGAAQLALQLEAIALPEGSRLGWHAPDGSVTHRYPNHTDGLWWSPFLPGEWGVLELRVPVNHMSSAQLQVVAVNHAFQDTETVSAKAADPCNIDAACPQGNDWTVQARATVRLTIANSALCSGTLMDNTAHDRRPLILTANHCGITTNNARSVTALFNYARSGCDSGTASLNDIVEGARRLGVSTEADTTLIELTSTIPPAFGARYAAWNARPPSEAIPQQGAALHHPDGDVRKISLYVTPARTRENVSVSSGLLSGFDVDAWVVNWQQGTTQQGSSGGGLFNESGALVGVLSGGTASCQNPNGDDFFGRLERAFSTSTAIANNLDPVNGGTARLSSATGGSGDGLPPLADGGGGGSGLSLLALMTALLAGRRVLAGPARAQ